MIKSLLPFIGALLLISSVYGEGTCNYGGCSTATKTERSVQDDSTQYAAGYGCVATVNISFIPGSPRFELIDGVNREVVDYTVTIMNTGSCPIFGAQVQIVVPGGANIRSTTNLNEVGSSTPDQTGTRVVTYDLVINQRSIASLSPGSQLTNVSITSSFQSSGFARSFEATITPSCMRSCLAKPTTSTTCRAETSISLRSGSSGVNSTNGNTYATYDVLIVNIGGCGIYEVGLDISRPGGVTFTSANGLVPADGGFKATGFRNTQGLLAGDVLPVENRYVASFTAEFVGRQPLNRFIVDSTSFCNGVCSSPLATIAPPSSGSAQCAAVATATYIPGSPRFVNTADGSKLAVDYELFFANYGFCNVYSILIAFAPYGGSAISGTTYLTPNGGGTYTTQENIRLAAPGDTNNQGRITVVYDSSGYAREVPVSTFQYECRNDCVPNNYATSDSSEDRTSTSSPTSVPTSPASNGKCAVTATATLRSTWKSGPTENRLYDFTITNTGSSTASTADISLAFSTASEITQSWNADVTSASSLRTKLYSVAPGSSFRGAGYILTIQDSVFTNGFTDPVVTVTSTQC